MAVNRTLWKEPLRKDYVPNWHCPSCSGGYLRLQLDSLHALQTRSSIKDQDADCWDPDWIRLRFTALLKCQNENCQESVSVAGLGKVEMMQISGNGDFDYVELYYPDFVKPSPNFIRVPKECPSAVRDELSKAFIAAWGDFSSAATHIRTSIELLLDFLKEPRIKLTKQKRRQTLTLHQRIKNFGNKDREISDALEAIKWVGNVGTHSSDISQDDVFDALDIIEFVLEETLVSRRKNLLALAKKVIKKKGRHRR